MKIITPKHCRLFFILLPLLGLTSLVGAHQAAHPKNIYEESLGETLSIKLIDHTLLNGKGQSKKFVSEIMGDKIVVLNFIYTDCKTVCPVSTHIMSEVYQLLAKKGIGKGEVQLITLTLNPKIDTIEKMSEFAERYATIKGQGWAWLTGSSSKVNEALLGLRAYSPVVEEHSNVILVGDPRVNHWTGFYQFPVAKHIVERVNQYLENR